MLNIDTGDTFSGAQWKKAIVQDYFLEGGAYCYKNMTGNQCVSLHYVQSEAVSPYVNTDHIFKNGYFYIDGNKYNDYQMIKILRKTRDGYSGSGILKENRDILSLAYASFVYENSLLQSGGNKRGFLTSDYKLSDEAMSALKRDFNKLYNGNTDAVVVLNKGVKFEQASSSSVEMQLGENRERNATEICRLFGVSSNVISGGGTVDENTASIRNGVKPVIDAIEAALNKDFLLESEKDNGTGEAYYFAFDDKMLDKGELKNRYAAYQSAVKAGWMTKNEIRYNEDMPNIEGLDILTMSLGEVIYDVNNKVYYTPNKDAITDIANKTTGRKIDLDNKEVIN